MQSDSATESPELRGVLSGYIDQVELAAQLGRTVRTLELWRAKRIGPPVTVAGRRVLYRVDAVKAWLRALEIEMVRDSKSRRGRRA